MEFLKYKLSGDYHWKEYEGLTSPEPMFGYRNHVDRIVDWVKEKKVLDVGCGDGLITSKLKCDGIDDNSEGIRLALKHGVNAKIGSAYDLEKFGKYDAVLLADTLEHLEFPEKAIREISKITNILYIAVPCSDLMEEFGYTAWNPQKLDTFMKKLGWKVLESDVFIKGREGEESKIYAKYTIDNR